MLTKKITDRFWTKVAFEDGGFGCWIWKAGKHGHGYGMFHTGRGLRKGSSEFAHRVSYEITYGQFDYSLHVLHKCDNTSCVNPYHLFLGTHEDNMKDRETKKRNIPRIRIPLPVHSAIKKAASILQNDEIACLLGVSPSHVSRVRRGLTRNYEG